MFTRVKLSNGLTIANFSSPHSFKFTTGEILEKCSPNWSREMSLGIKESKKQMNLKNGTKSWTDVLLTIDIPKNVLYNLATLVELESIDIVIVPLMVLNAIKSIDDDTWEQENLKKILLSKCRTVRIADRVTKEIYPDKFCI